jgi:hypothetical protein
MLALVLVLVARPCAAQTGFQARLSADTVEVGEVFELLVRVPVPAGSVVHFPDTVATTEVVESYAPVSWEAEPDPTGGATLMLAYPVIVYGAGMMPVPGFDVFVGPSPAGAPGSPLPGGSVVGAWEDAPTRGDVYVRPLRVPRRGIWVNPVFTPEQVEAGLQPMAAADVIGASWHWPSVLVGLFFAGLLVVVAARALRAGLGPSSRWALAAPGGTPWTPEASRRHALDELDRLREEDLPAKGRTLELFTRSSGIIRSYVERLDPSYGADLTSSELTRRLQERANERDRSILFGEMRTAEVVKFGRLRPEGEEADTHLRSLRTWVDGSSGW